MAITQKNQLLIAFKKLLGKAHTNSSFGFVNESVSSNIQLGLKDIFSDPIPTAPSSTEIWSTTVNSLGYTVAQCVKFNLVEIPSSVYTNAVNDVLAGTTIEVDGDTAPALSGYHAYSLQLPADIEFYIPGEVGPNFPFLNNTNFTASNGLLQLIPPTFGVGYTAEVSSSSGIIPDLGVEDYVLDYNSGILFVQDIGRIPTSVKAHLYVGNFGNKKITSEFISASFLLNAYGVGAITTNFTHLTTSNGLVNNNLTVLGTASIAMLNTVNQQSLQIGDKHIIIMSGATDHATLSGSGILWGSGSTGPTYGPNGEHAYVRYDSVTDKLEIFPGLETNAITASSISASNFVGLPDTSIILKNEGVALGTITSLDVVGNGVNATFSSNAGTITVSDASDISSGVVTTGNQRFAGIKTFDNAISASTGVSGALGIFTDLTGSNISATSYQGIYPYDASSITVLRNDPTDINKPYWSVITEDMVVKLITVSLSTNTSTQRELSVNLVKPPLRAYIQNEYPSSAIVTNDKHGENIDVKSLLLASPLNNWVSFTSSVDYSGSGNSYDSLQFTISVVSSLSPSSPPKLSATTYYWGRYMYWGAHTTNPDSLTADESFIKGLASSTGNYRDGEKKLVGGSGLESVTYTRKFTNVPGPVGAYMYVAYPNSLLTNPTGFNINGNNYLVRTISNPEYPIRDFGTFSVSLENLPGQRSINYRLLGLINGFTATAISNEVNVKLY